jgi:hypothetical protein
MGMNTLRYRKTFQFCNAIFTNANFANQKKDGYAIYATTHQKYFLFKFDKHTLASIATIYTIGVAS